MEGKIIPLKHMTLWKMKRLGSISSVIGTAVRKPKLMDGMRHELLSGIRISLASIGPNNGENYRCRMKKISSGVM